MDLNEVIEKYGTEEDFLKLRLFAECNGILEDETSIGEEWEDKVIYRSAYENISRLKDCEPVKEAKPFAYRSDVLSPRYSFFDLLENWCENSINSDYEYTDYFLNECYTIYLCTPEATEEDYQDKCLVKFKAGAELNIRYYATEDD